MNGTFFKNPNFSEGIETNYKLERNEYNILKDNTSKKVKLYTSIKGEEKTPKTFSGIFEFFKDDSIILSDPSTGNWLFIPIEYVYYIEFEEKMIF